MAAGANSTAAGLARAATRLAGGGSVTDLGFANGGAVDDSERPYRVLGPRKIWLSKTAREFGKGYGVSDREMADHLLRMDRIREAGMTDADVPRFGETEEDMENFQPQAETTDDPFYQRQPERSMTSDVSVNVEDRREDEPYVPDELLRSKTWGL